jgi:Heterokaryon incompatibility protein (HET)
MTTQAGSSNAVPMHSLNPRLGRRPSGPLKAQFQRPRPAQAHPQAIPSHQAFQASNVTQSQTSAVSHASGRRGSVFQFRKHKAEWLALAGIVVACGLGIFVIIYAADANKLAIWEAEKDYRLSCQSIQVFIEKSYAFIIRTDSWKASSAHISPDRDPALGGTLPPPPFQSPNSFISTLALVRRSIGRLTAPIKHTGNPEVSGPKIISIPLWAFSLCATLFIYSHFGRATGLKSFFNISEVTSKRLSDYTYQALESPSHTRIVELLPTRAQCDRDVRCRIHHIDLKAPTHDYVALSYALGDPIIKSKRIYIDNNQLASVTATLYFALTRLRSESKSLFLWIDALSINQAEDPKALAERSVQVGMMHTIFSSAVKVVIDLGDVPKDDKVIIDGLTRFESVDGEQWDELLSMEKTIYDRKVRVTKPSWTDRDAARLASWIKVPKATEPFWFAFHRLVRRSWFFRAWVVQEFALGKESEVMLGSNILNLDFFNLATQRAIKFNLILGHRPETGHPSLFAIRILWDVLKTLANLMLWGTKASKTMLDEQASKANPREVYKSNFGAMYDTRLTVQDTPYPWRRIESLRFSTLFFRYRFFKCTDPRDHVYALLGLAIDKTASELYVDYSESVERLSARISRYIASCGLGIVALYFAACGTAKSPSWAISIAQDTPIDFLRRLMLDSIKEDCNLFRACGSTVLDLRFLPETDHLLVRGVLIGTIYSQTSPFPMDPPVQFPANPGKSIVGFLVCLPVWAHSVSSWIQMTSYHLSNLSEYEFRTKCSRALFADLGVSRQGEMCRLGTLPGNEVYTWATNMLFDRRTGAREWVQALTKAKEALIVLIEAISVLFKLLPGRRLGGARSHSDCKTESLGEARSTRGWICLLPEAAQIGDKIGIFYGCPIPFVLRRKPDCETYQLVGCCYVDNAMDGQIVEGEEWLEQDIILS